MSVIIGSPTKTITAYNDETFATQQEAVECANWLNSEYGEDAAEMFVFEKNDGEWVVAW
ncbi:hypothetical protein [Pantoea sp. 1.19]|uniref:hypothetical protein n=1 Tax=Pantoea sp. 1.19 TaxID=1925589 RepID=UPI00147E4D52|nr:hypothetical protein [Pantoea sp. 1.19]